MPKGFRKHWIAPSSTRCAENCASMSALSTMTGTHRVRTSALSRRNTISPGIEQDQIGRTLPRQAEAEFPQRCAEDLHAGTHSQE